MCMNMKQLVMVSELDERLLPYKLGMVTEVSGAES